MELLPSFHLTGLAPDGIVGPSIPIRCDLLGPEDQILHSHRCRLTDPHAPELLDPSGGF